MTGHHALIFGASGITGWAITKALLEGYPHQDTFSKVTALTNRPLPPEVARWPQSEKLQVVSGLDLLTSNGLKGLEEEMRSRIKDVESVSHVYFFGMKPDSLHLRASVLTYLTAYIMDPDPKV